VVNWRTDAVLWFSDTDKGLVLAGSFGFVWWARNKVFCAPFTEYNKSPVIGFKKYMLWNSVKSYDSDSVTRNSLLRFVRSGLMP
jgi:hypothetical protein